MNALDIYRGRMNNRYRYIFFLSLLLTFNILFMPAVCRAISSSGDQVFAQTKVNGSTESHPNTVQTLVVSEREIDLGSVPVGRDKEAIFFIKGVGTASQAWTVSMPEAWFPLGKTELMGISVGNEEKISIRIRAIERTDFFSDDIHVSMFPVQIILENRSTQLICVRELPAGSHREAIRIEGAAGPPRVLHIRFHLTGGEENAESPVSLSIYPVRLDYGKNKRGQSISKRVLITNKGPGTIDWNIQVAPFPSNRDDHPHILEQYISFENNNARNKGIYTVPSHLGQQLRMRGTWAEQNGYPVTRDKSALKLDFYGRSLSLLFKKAGQREVRFTGYIDNVPVRSDGVLPDTDDTSGEMKLLLSDNLQERHHTLTLEFGEDGVMLEGILTKRRDITEGDRKHIIISPTTGSTAKQTSYINITINTAQALPGVYTNQILVASIDDKTIIPLYYEVTPDQLGSIDVYRYRGGSSYLYAPGIPSEDLRLTSRGFVKEGLAFRLFQPDVPATLPLHKWYNPGDISQFYSYDLAQGNRLKGYVYEGVIGNIATSKIDGTRELYRWFNPKTKRFLFAMDPRGTERTKKGYIFQGITGYVKH